MRVIAISDSEKTRDSGFGHGILYPKSHQINLTFGSQFGFQAGGLQAPAELGFLRVAVLSKSRLSGHISGVHFAYVDEGGNYRTNKNEEKLGKRSINGQSDLGGVLQSEFEASNCTPSEDCGGMRRGKTSLTRDALIKFFM